MKPKIIVYLPVIHRGYLSFFNKYTNTDIFIANKNLIELFDSEFDYLRKEIRSITPQQAEVSLKALLPERKISLIGTNDLTLLNEIDQQIILPNEDIFIWLAENYLSNSKISFDSTFLRWNRNNISKKQELKNLITIKEAGLYKKIRDLSSRNQELSSDWWRQVSAIIFSETGNEQQILISTNNQHIPSPYTPYIDSDPRNAAHKGETIEISTAIHAESAAIAECAKKGISVNKKSIYISTFPCPVCAKLIASSGIRTLYFKNGYAMLDGEKVLKDAGIKIIRVN